MIAYWLKDMVAYYKNAARRGQPRIIAFMCCVFSGIYSPNLSVEVVLNLDDKGEHRSETESMFLISLHDSHDTEDLLRQTEGQGINIYAHSEMLSDHFILS